VADYDLRTVYDDRGVAMGFVWQKRGMRSGALRSRDTVIVNAAPGRSGLALSPTSDLPRLPWPLALAQGYDNDRG
jgi:hypothetical protein